MISQQQPGFNRIVNVNLLFLANFAFEIQCVPHGQKCAMLSLPPGAIGHLSMALKKSDLYSSLLGLVR
jgi:hypothetical protein